MSQPPDPRDLPAVPDWRELPGLTDWSGHVLGQPATWPAALQTIVDTMLGCSFPMFVAWGPELSMVYNAAYAPILGDRHPAAMGRPMAETWAGIWPEISPIVDRALAGQSTLVEDLALQVNRNKRQEPAWFTFSYSPIHDGAGKVAGILGIVKETTGDVVLKQRQAFRLDLLEQLRRLMEPGAIISAATRLLGTHLGAGRVLYANIDGATFSVGDDWTDGRLPSMSGHSGGVGDFGAGLFEDASAGRTVAVSDVKTDALTGDRAAALAGIGVRALLSVPLVKNGQLIATLNVHRAEPYHWTRADISIAEDTAQHTWAAIERAQVENALKSRTLAEANRLRELVNLTPGAIAVLRGKSHVFDFANEAYLRLVGRRDIVGRPLWEALPDAAGQGFEEILDGVLRTGRPYVAHGVRLELQPQPDQPPAESYVDLLYQPMFAADGRVTGVFSQVNDVTDNYRAQAALRQSEARFRAAISAIGIMWTNNAEGEMCGPQPGWTAVTGQAEADYAGYGWTKVVHPEDAGPTLLAWKQAVSGRRVFDFEHRLHTVAQGWRLFSIRAVPVLTHDGAIAEWVGVHVDITDARRSEDRLKETDRRKDEFLATLAHELRNPLAPIRTAAHALGAGHLPEVQRAGLHEVIARQTRNMSLLLDDLLDVSRISNGRLELRKETVLMSAVLETAIEAARPLIDAKHHRLELSLPPQPLLVEGDRLRLSQVVTNLLNNSAKYSDPGGVISLSLAREATGLSITVADTGIGIDAQSLPYIFDMFSQVKSAIDRSEGGLGIGLSLARGIVALHGGLISAESGGPGCGTAITVRLPAAMVREDQRHATGAPALDAAAAHACSVLVVDDNVDAAGTFGMVLGLEGHEVVAVHSGIQALEACAKKAFDVAVLDIGMPGMTGYELARRIRGEPWGHDMLLIALTGWGQAADKRKALAAGFDHHFTKPIDPAAILELLAGRCDRRRRP